MESEDHATESLFFDNLQLSQIVNEPLADNDPPVGDEVYRTDEANPIGPGLFLPVIPGDRVEMSVYGYFDGGTAFNSTLPVENLTNELTTMFNAVDAGAEIPLVVNEIVSDIFSSGFGAIGSGTEDDAPAAYLNYLMFDEEMNLVTGESGFERIPDNAIATPKQLSVDYSVNSRGHLFMYLSNESNEDSLTNAVFWDDLKITHHESPIVQVDDYYPFGLTFNGWQRMGVKENDFLYQGKEIEKELGFKLYDFHVRGYDPKALDQMVSELDFTMYEQDASGMRKDRGGNKKILSEKVTNKQAHEFGVFDRTVQKHNSFMLKMINTTYRQVIRNSDRERKG